MSEDIKTMSLRMPAGQAGELEAVARVDGVSVAEAVRSAIQAHIDARRADAQFQARLRRSLEEQRDILDRLAR
jgi:hypothetical protein